MPSNFKIVGTGNITFGTAEIDFATIGTITGGGQKKTGEKLELKNGYGNTFVVIFFDDKDECEIEAILDAGYAMPDRGDLIDIMGLVNVVVIDWDIKWSSGKEKGVTLRATKYAHVVPD